MIIAKGDKFNYIANPFKIHYEDANNYFETSELHKRNGHQELEARSSRLSILLYVLALEALINRILDRFCISALPNFLKDEKIYSLKSKFYLAPVLCGCKERFKVDREPFQSFSEFVEIRNSYVHGKISIRKTKIVSSEKTQNGRTVHILDDKFPENLWSHTQIPKDFYIMKYEDALKAKDMAKAMIDELDRIFDGKIKKNNWYLSEEMKKINK